MYEFIDSKMATAIKAKTSEITRNFLPPTLNVVFVTDNTANIKAAHKNDLCLCCAGFGRSISTHSCMIGDICIKHVWADNKI